MDSSQSKPCGDANALPLGAVLPGKRISSAKVLKLLLDRARSCWFEAELYSQKAREQGEAKERDFYVHMAATERCAAMEVANCARLLFGNEALRAGQLQGPAQGNSGRQT